MITAKNHGIGASRIIRAYALLTCIGVVVYGAPARAAPALPVQDVTADPYSPSESESSCDPTEKPGTIALRAFVLRAYPATTDKGIVRSCSVGGSSSHWQGRGWDWGVDANDPEERAWADDFLGSLVATDEHGQAHARARRLGIRYYIWKARLYASYYSPRYSSAGSEGHYDHVHFSLSWPGASATTDAYRNMYMAPDSTSWSAIDQANFFRAADNSVRQRSLVGGAWVDANNFGGVVNSGATATSWGANRVDLFARDPGGNLQQKSWEPSIGWIPAGGFNPLGAPAGGMTSGPDAASWTSGEGNRLLSVLARGPNRELWVRTYNSKTSPVGWSAWQRVPDPGILTSDPGAVSWQAGRIDVFVRSTNNGIYHKWCCSSANPYGSWSGWNDLGGVLEGGPDAAARGPNDLWVFARNPGGEIFVRRWKDTAWSAWFSIGRSPSGNFTSDPTAVVRNGEVHVAARGSDGVVWGRYWHPTAGWSPAWSNLGGNPY